MTGPYTAELTWGDEVVPLTRAALADALAQADIELADGEQGRNGVYRVMLPDGLARRVSEFGAAEHQWTAEVGDRTIEVTSPLPKGSGFWLTA